MCHRAKFHQNWPNGFGDIVIFRFLRWPPFVILDFKIFKRLVTRHVGMSNMHRGTKLYQNWSWLLRYCI